MCAAAVRVVTPFEGKLLRLLRGFVGHVPREQVLPLAAERAERPATLSRACVALVEDTLAKGCMLLLARAGGWRRERFLRGGTPRDGRLWERSAPADLGLSFSRHTLEFLIWLTAQGPGAADPPPRLPAGELTPGDRLLLFLAYDVLRESEAVPALHRHPAFAGNGLVRLACVEDFAGAEDDPAHYGPWVEGPGAAILEALQPLLAARWVKLVRGQGRIGDWATLAALGRAEEQTLAALLDAAETAGRPDLVRFVLRAAGAILTPELPATFFFAGLQGSGPGKLAERLEVHRRALALPRGLERLHAWVRRARSVGYLDEGYAVSQLAKADWEALRGDELAAIAAGLVRQVEPLKVQ